MLKKIYSNLIDLLAIRKSDILLVSYPKTGNTWLRFFFMNLYNRKERVFEEIGFKELDTYFLEIGHGRMRESFVYKNQPRVIKTHKKAKPFLGKFSNRVVYMIRDPRDTMVSFFNYTRNKDSISQDLSFHDFIRHQKFGLEPYFRHYKTWSPKIGHLVTYEALKGDKDKEFKSLVKGLFGDLYSEAEIEEAIYHSDFDQVKKSEKERGHSKEVYARKGVSFTRSGKTQQWKEYFSEADLSYYEAMKEKYRFDLY